MSNPTTSHLMTNSSITGTNSSSKPFASNKAGISGIIKKKEEQHAANTENLDAAFSDLKVLMKKAEEMVVLADYLKQHHAKGQDREVGAILCEMGIDAPVTKELAGDQFSQDLARQVYEFISAHPKMVKDGMLSLTDVYCLYNRARGIGLISPDDLYQACLLFGASNTILTGDCLESLRLPMRLCKHASGLVTLQSQSVDDRTMMARIKTLIAEEAFPLSYEFFE